MDIGVSWSELPEELLPLIGKYLQTRFDIIRFRSVCRRWRSSLPCCLSDSHGPLKKDHNPHSDSESSSKARRCTFLYRSAVYILNQYPVVPCPIPTPWLLGLEETKEGKLRVVNPISNCPFNDLPTTFPKVLNLLDSPILQVSRGYFFKYHVRLVFGTSEIVTAKAVILPESDLIRLDDADAMILFLRPDGRLSLSRCGYEDWVDIIDEDHVHYDDIAVYRGRFVAVDRWGTVSIVDFSSKAKPKVTKYTPPIFNGGSRKHLAVFCEHLYLVDRYLDRARTTQNPYEKVYAKVVAFKVHKFDEEWGWKEVTSLDDKMLFIGQWLNFFVPTKELSGCKGNCIYFIDEKRTWYDDEDKASIGSTGDGMAVFNLEDGRIGKLSSFSGYSDMFWPPPTCFTANQNPS